MERARPRDVAFLRAALDMQFGGRAREVAEELAERLWVTRYAGGSPRAFYLDGREPYFYVDARLGRLTLSEHSAKLVFERCEGKRIIVDGEIFEKFAKNVVLAPAVKAVSEDVRAGDEVFIVDERGRLLALGKALISAEELRGLKRGEVARIRRRLGT